MLILAVDQGTTGTTTVLYNDRGEALRRAYREITQYYPQPGWVEHDAREIWDSVQGTLGEVLQGVNEPIAALGITNQRETTVLWDRVTGQPRAPAIVWQCRRTQDLCARLQHVEALIRTQTGLTLDPYFSASKIRWLLDHNDIDVAKTAFGTIDSWLLWNLTSGEVHATDYTNASRTLLFDIHQRQWDVALCAVFSIPETILPAAYPSCHRFGNVSAIPALKGVPIYALVGDQQAALFGQRCVHGGAVKNTYGTGCFAMMNTGGNAISSRHGLLTTLALDADAKSCYAIEGSVYMAGAVVQWLRDELKIIQSAAETEALALSLADNAGVYLVPAFVGLGAPHWDSAARGLICGLTRGAGRAHLARAALESMAYQTYDVLTAMRADSGCELSALVVDGGAASNNFLLQFQADIAQLQVMRPAWLESTSMGAAMLAGIGAGIWDVDRLPDSWNAVERRFAPQMSAALRAQNIDGWNRALAKTRL